LKADHEEKMVKKQIVMTLQETLMKQKDKQIEQKETEIKEII
jgi:hypothetical protein